MRHERQHYVDGAWVDPLQPVPLDVIDPSAEEAFTFAYDSQSATGSDPLL
jgi:hypothetical protein